MTKQRQAIIAILYLLLFVEVNNGAVVTGTYDPMPGGFGVTSGTGPWQLTSTDLTFSLLRFTPDTVFEFDQFTDLSVAFTSPTLNAQTPVSQALLNAGGGGGAPRLSVALDTDNNSTIDGAILIHLGNPPSYIDPPATLTLNSGLNLIGNNDAGRYDLSQFGGSNFSTYSAALASFAGASVIRYTLILDSFGGADKTLDVTSIDAAAVPEASQILIGGIACCFGSLAYAIQRLRLARGLVGKPSCQVSFFAARGKLPRAAFLATGAPVRQNVAFAAYAACLFASRGYVCICAA